MVRFEKDKYIIEVKTGTFSSENWAVALRQMVWLLNNQDPDSSRVDQYEILNLLGEMLPTIDQAELLEKAERGLILMPHENK